MFLFDDRDLALPRGTGQFELISEKLFFNPSANISAIEFVDFDRSTLKQLQFRATQLEQSMDTISAPLSNPIAK